MTYYFVGTWQLKTFLQQQEAGDDNLKHLHSDALRLSITPATTNNLRLHILDAAPAHQRLYSKDEHLNSQVR